MEYFDNLQLHVCKQIVTDDISLEVLNFRKYKLERN